MASATADLRSPFWPRQGMVNTKRIISSSSLITCITQLPFLMPCVHVGRHRNFGDAGALSIRTVAWLTPWRHTYVPSCQIWSLLVKRYKRTYGNRCKDLTLAAGHSRSLKVKLIQLITHTICHFLLPKIYNNCHL